MPHTKSTTMPNATPTTKPITVPTTKSPANAPTTPNTQPPAPTEFVIGERLYYCPVQLTVDTVAGKWKPMIVWHLVQLPSMRYGEIKQALRSVTHKMLTQSLRELEADGLVLRTVHEVVPPHVDYALTAAGQRLSTLFFAMQAFGAAYKK